MLKLRLLDDGSPEQFAEFPISDGMVASLKGILAAGESDGPPRYSGVADLIFSTMAEGLFSEALRIKPTTEVQAAQAAADAAQVSLEQAKKDALGKPDKPVDPIAVAAALDAVETLKP